jgi:cytochrome c2
MARSEMRNSLRFTVLLAVVVCGACGRERHPTPLVHNADADRGRAALIRLDCGVCHVIDDIPGAIGQVGPRLRAYARQPYIAGKFPNEPEILVRWIENPPALAPQTAMPAIPMSQADARDIAAYLYERS